MKSNLVIVRAGDKSLHPQWLSSDERNWDIVVSYYGNYSSRYKDQYDILHEQPGSKWEGLNNFISNNKELIYKYNNIWMPDDDLLTNSSNINRFFILCDELNLTISQPALTNNSYFSWDITLQHQNTKARLTNFIEVMAPCFKTESLHKFSQYFGENTSGWGYEWLWADIAVKNNIMKFGIIDETPVYHTRPVGVAGHGGSRKSPYLEMNELFVKYKLEKHQPLVLQEIVA